MSGQIEKNDQMMPYLVAKVFSNKPGMAGAFISGMLTPRVKN